MYNVNIEANVLINGKPVATYRKDGKVYVEAKEGSEYEIQIKNNLWKRILAISSVDGLNVLNGESASPDDSGYVINGYNSYRIKGFRYSDEKVGAFKFVKKESSYASDKKDGSDANCGIIGIRVYDEYTTPVSTYYRPLETNGGWDNLPPYTITCNNNGVLRSMNMSNASDNSLSLDSAYYSSKLSDTTNQVKSLSFDMGSTWGESKESKVTSTTFQKGSIIFSLDIYYASRQSLIEMGVIEANKPQVAFPNSFPRYATPPKNWVE